MVKKILLVLLVSFFITACNNKQEVNENFEIEGKALTINCDKAMDKVNDGGYLIDVRTEKEYSLNHIEGALNIPLDKIKEEIVNEVEDKNQTIILYCQSGNRSSQALDILSGLGYTDVYDLGAINKCEV